jgi:hypothetical protein
VTTNTLTLSDHASLVQDPDVPPTPRQSNDPFAATLPYASKAMGDAERGTQLVNGAMTAMVYVICQNWEHVFEVEGEATKNNPAFSEMFTVAEYCAENFLADVTEEAQRNRIKAASTKQLLYRMAGLDPEETDPKKGAITQAHKQCLLRAVPVARGLMDRLGGAVIGPVMELVEDPETGEKTRQPKKDDKGNVITAPQLTVTKSGNLRVPGHVMLKPPADDAKDSEIETYERNADLPFVIDGTTKQGVNRTFAALQRAVAPDRNDGTKAGQGAAAKAASRLDVLKAWIGPVKIGDDRSGMDWVAFIADHITGEEALEALLSYLGENGDEDAQKDYETICGVDANA